MGRISHPRTAEIYPDDAVRENARKGDVIDIENMASLSGLLQERIARSGDLAAYWQFSESENSWQSVSWSEIGRRVTDWRKSISAEQLEPGDRIAIRLSNSVEWVLADQSALAEGMVVVPVYHEDRADNIAYVLEDTSVKLLYLEGYEQWLEMEPDMDRLESLQRVIIISGGPPRLQEYADSRVVDLEQWLETGRALPEPGFPVATGSVDTLATIVYTSGTTGKPKGVMLSHKNLLCNAYAGLQSIAIFPDDRFVSFLPLSHMFERTVGYYLTLMAGAQVFFARSIDTLMDDIQFARPTALVTVPRIFEKSLASIRTRLESSSWIEKHLFHFTVYAGWQKFQFEQGRSKSRISQIAWPLLDRIVAAKIREKFGGRIRLAVCGGARLDPDVSKTFIALGIPVLQGYGLTETSPVLTVNVLSNNRPETIGLPFRSVEIRLAQNGELQVRSPFNMLGYWNNETASREIQDADGWLGTGDIATIDDGGFISITGRIKEIIVLANGEKVPPADMESAIMSDPLFDQVMLVGEGRPYLTAIVVVNPVLWENLRSGQEMAENSSDHNFTEDDRSTILERIRLKLAEFPGYAFVRHVHPDLISWTIGNGLITPTLKLKRAKLLKFYRQEIERMYMD